MSFLKFECVYFQISKQRPIVAQCCIVHQKVNIKADKFISRITEQVLVTCVGEEKYIGKTNTDLPRKKQSCGSRGAAKELLQSHWNNCHIIDFFRYLSDLGNGYENNKKKSIQIAGAYLSCHSARGRVHPGRVASPSQGHTETNKTMYIKLHTHPSCGWYPSFKLGFSTRGLGA